MIRRIAIACMALVAVGLPALGGCSGASSSRTSINHVVLVTLNDPSQREALAGETRAMLAHIPGVEAFSVGTPVDIGRSAVDGAYDVGFVARFDGREAYEACEHDAEHVRLRESWRSRVKQIRMYDFGGR